MFDGVMVMIFLSATTGMPEAQHIENVNLEQCYATLAPPAFKPITAEGKEQLVMAFCAPIQQGTPMMDEMQKQLKEVPA